jgi:hypothetical protein
VWRLGRFIRLITYPITLYTSAVIARRALAGRQNLQAHGAFHQRVGIGDIRVGVGIGAAAMDVEAPDVLEAEIVQGAIVKKFKVDPRRTRVDTASSRQGLVVLEESGARVEVGRSLHILISGI